MKETVEENKIPESCKTSRTVMIPPKNKPNFNEIRPPSLTNVSYKLAMAILRLNIVEQIKKTGMSEDKQAGFSEGGSVKNNLLILKHCMKMTYD